LGQVLVKKITGAVDMKSHPIMSRQVTIAFALATALLTLSGCESAEEKAKRIEAEKKAIAERIETQKKVAAEKALSNLVQQKVSEFRMQLIDPNSAVVNEITLYEDGTLCGKVNSKNRMGGYVGFTEFAFKDGVAMVKTEERVPEVYSDGMNWEELGRFQASSEMNRAIMYACLLNKSPVKYRGD